MKPNFIKAAVPIRKGAATEFEKTFNIDKPFSSATLTATALGIYDVSINEKRIGNDELKPGFTECGKRVLTDCYDVSDYIKIGLNFLNATVTDGWWSGTIAAGDGRENAFYCVLEIIYEDNTKESFVSDQSFLAIESSLIKAAGIYEGESYDACGTIDFTNAPNAVIHNGYSGKITPNLAPVRIRDDLERRVQGINIFEEDKIISACSVPFLLEKGKKAVVDFGQNAAGWIKFTVKGKRGSNLKIRHGEMINDSGCESRGNDGPAGSLYTANLRGIPAEINYKLSGKASETYRPRFTFFGFRYAELTCDEDVLIEKLSAQTVTSSLTDTGFIETSNELVNKLISNIKWGQYSNYLSIPTDCPQRNERLGWTADTQVFSITGMYNSDVKDFLVKWLQDLRDSQNENGAYPATAPRGFLCDTDSDGAFGWADAGIIVPYNLYKMYGDKSPLEEHYASMVKFMDSFMASTGKTGGKWHFGDWLAYEGNDDEIKNIGSVAYYAYDAYLMSQMADLLGKYDDKARYLRIFEEEKKYFNDMFIEPDGRMKRDCQTPCLMALRYNLIDNRVPVIKQLVDNIKRNGNRLQTGFLGTAIIMTTLSDIGENNLAYELLLQEKEPSWLYSVNQGASTVWERWNSYTKETGFGDVGMNSFNHYAYGAVGEWMYSYMAGIKIDYFSDEPIVIAPQPDRLINSIKSSFRGIQSNWYFKKDKWYLEVVLPENVSAVVKLPYSGDKILLKGGRYTFTETP